MNIGHILKPPRGLKTDGLSLLGLYYNYGWVGLLIKTLKRETLYVCEPPFNNRIKFNNISKYLISLDVKVQVLVV